eukprot:4395796-Alexandrium_andersonii.AAC.1
MEKSAPGAPRRGRACRCRTRWASPLRQGRRCALRVQSRASRSRNPGKQQGSTPGSNRSR